MTKPCYHALAAAALLSISCGGLMGQLEEELTARNSGLPPTYTLSYDANGADSGSVPIDTTTYLGGETVTLPDAGDLARADYFFAGWTTPAEGRDGTYIAGDGLTIAAADIRLYAVWIPESLRFTLSARSVTIDGYNGTMPSGELRIPAGVTGIKDQAFMYCDSLTRVSLPESLTAIGASAFWGCSTMTDINLPDSIARIGSAAFFNCYLLDDVLLPSGLTSIEENTFDGCVALTSLSLPPSVTSIGVLAFYNCASLPSLGLPVGLISIGRQAFYGCKKLASITIPASVTIIGPSAFESCRALASVTVQANRPPSVSTGSFYPFQTCAAVEAIYVPADAVDDYKTAAGWSDYASLIFGF